MGNLKASTITKTLTPLGLARKNLGLTIREVHADLGIPRATYHRIETGANLPCLEHARLIYEYFKGHLDYAQVFDPEYISPPKRTKKGKKLNEGRFQDSFQLRTNV